MEAQVGRTSHSSLEEVDSLPLTESAEKLRTYGCRKRRLGKAAQKRVDGPGTTESKKRPKVQLYLDAGQKVQ